MTVIIFRAIVWALFQHSSMNQAEPTWTLGRAMGVALGTGVAMVPYSGA